jgi:hypothetical protein
MVGSLTQLVTDSAHSPAPTGSIQHPACQAVQHAHDMNRARWSGWLVRVLIDGGVRCPCNCSTWDQEQGMADITIVMTLLSDIAAGIVSPVCAHRAVTKPP